MSKKIIRIIFMFIITIVISSIATNYVLAESSGGSASQFINAMEKKIPDGAKTPMGQSIKGFGDTIIRAIQVVGTGIGVLMLIYIAIKYMAVAPSEKAEFKKTAVTFIIGAVILFGAMTILGLIRNIMINLSTSLLK